MATDISLLAAFVAGILSISSPCVLPLVPIYLAHIAGVSVGETGGPARVALLRNGLAYVAGFSLIFIALGAAMGTAATIIELVPQNRSLLVKIGGVLLIALGLYQTGLIRIPLLDRTHGLALEPGSPGTMTSSFVIGVSFGAGWTPCITPILGGILTMAAGQGSIERATLLLTCYTLGLGIPFLLVAAAFGSAPGVLRTINGRLHAISLVSGAVMLGVGVIMLLGLYEVLITEIVRNAPWSPWEPSL